LKKTAKLLTIGTSILLVSLFLIIEGLTCHCFGYSHIRSDCKSCILLDINDPQCEPGAALEPFIGSILLFIGVLVISEWKYKFDFEWRGGNVVGSEAEWSLVQYTSIHNF